MASRDTLIVERVCGWFRGAGRALPWRSSPRDPYRSLVSEFMLQQTQVARVLEKFGPFLEKFPTLRRLAAAPEQRVLAAWSGLGYYRRARGLHASARVLVDRFGGTIPSDVAALRTLPGVGPYTAGAVASIVFGRPEPIVDGNIARVLLRVEGRDLAQREGLAWAWERSTRLVRRCGSGTKGPGVFNEGLMELGAVVCTPRSPRCHECPLRTLCVARRRGKQEDIPRPKARSVRRVLHCASVVACDGRGRLLVERRDDSSMWAGLWQAPTLETNGSTPTRARVSTWIGSPVARLDRFDVATSHRDVRFSVWRAEGRVRRPGAVWRTRRQIAGLALSNAQARILLESPSCVG